MKNNKEKLTKLYPKYNFNPKESIYSIEISEWKTKKDII